MVLSHRVCRLCGTRDDAFGCYETCSAGGPFHEWIDPPARSHAEVRGTHLTHHRLYGQTRPCPCEYCAWREPPVED